MTSRACKNVIRPSGLIGTSFRAVSGISKSDRFSTSPGPSVSFCCQAARLSGARTDNETFAGAASSAVNPILEPARRQTKTGIHLFKEGLFIVNSGCTNRSERQKHDQDLK